MNIVLNKHRVAIAQAVTGLVNALSYLEDIEKDVKDSLKDKPHGHDDEMLALRLTRTIGHLHGALGDLPCEMLARTFAKSHVGHEEMFQRVKRFAAAMQVPA